jgi:GNAT superfamily N-acetyltransferase
VAHTDVLQLFCDVTLNNRSPSHLPTELCWQPAESRSRDDLLQLIRSTFVDTLDCPILNQLRSADDVLSGFQDGRKLAELPTWHLLHDTQQASDVGCLFLTRHSSEVLEIVYLGLTPSARGRRLGVSLINKALQTASELGARLLVAGVDCANWPALQAYYNQGFELHQSKSVFFRASDLVTNQ